MFLSEDWDGAMLDELIGPTDANDRCVDHLRMQMFHYRAPKTVVQNMIFNRADDLDAAGERFKRSSVQRLDPTWIDKRNRNSFLFQFGGGFFRNLKHIAQAENRYVAPMLHDFRFADLEKFRLRFDLRARS